MGSVNLTGCTLAYGPNSERRCEWDGRGLRGRQKRWCSRACADAAVANHCWTDARAAALKRDHSRCVVCGDPFTLQVHHDPVAPDYKTGCQHHLGTLTTLCRAHHVDAHAALRAVGKDQPRQLSLLGRVA